MVADARSVLKEDMKKLNINRRTAMKHPVKWYENNLVNSMKFHQELLRKIEYLEGQANRLKESNNFLSLQIIEAKIMRKDSFDDCKFLKKSRLTALSEDSNEEVKT